MGHRRKAREYALQLLFSSDLGRSGRREARREAGRFPAFWAERHTPLEVQTFAESLVQGVEERVVELDAIVARHATNWSLDRMAAVDRNVLRLAVYELFYGPSIPERVVLNEAIEIAKKYGSEDSGSFVNGILDDVIKTDQALKELREAERAHASDSRR